MKEGISYDASAAAVGDKLPQLTSARRAQQQDRKIGDSSFEIYTVLICNSLDFGGRMHFFFFFLIAEAFSMHYYLVLSYEDRESILLHGEREILFFPVNYFITEIKSIRKRLYYET